MFDAADLEAAFVAYHEAAGDLLFAALMGGFDADDLRAFSFKHTANLPSGMGETATHTYYAGAFSVGVLVGAAVVRQAREEE